MESVDQSPGRRIPLTHIAAADGRLSFAISTAQISYAGEWMDNEERWHGVFTQAGTRFPLTLVRGLPASRPVVKGMDGVWEGVVTRNGVGLRLRLRIGTSARGTIVTFDAPDLGVSGVPVAGFSRKGQDVGFTVPVSGARFMGAQSHDRERLSGNWTLPGQPDAPVTFVRANARSARESGPRPQTPRGPFPYLVEEISFANPGAPGVTLAGTLTLPQGKGPFPAAVLISGSGPHDRDATLFGHRPFAVMADHLTRAGVAVLRYDDRGVGGSTGEHAAATSADFATDAQAAVRYLITRPEIDSRGVGLIGHSEGGMIAPIAAVDDETVAFIVSLAGPGTNLIQLLQSQRRLTGLALGVSEEELTRAAPLLADVFAAIASASSTADAQRRVRAMLTPAALEILGTPEAAKEMLVQQIATEWFRYFMQYDPAVVFSRIAVPVLAINGSLHRQVPADENLAAIAAALAHNPNVTIRKLEGLNHLFQRATTGALGEYADLAETISPAALRLVSEWILARFGRNGRA